MFLLSLVLVLIVLGWIHFYLQSKQKKLTTNVAEVKKELELYKKKDREIKVLRQKLKTLEQRKKVIEGLEADRFKPVHVLDNLTQKVVPNRMWLTKMSLQSNRMDLAGIAVDNNTVANFMDNLEMILKMPAPDKSPEPLYQRVRLTSVQSTKIRDVGMKQFQMTALEKQPPPKKPDKKKKKKRK
ncbi:MAG: PilN domain-containing protein [Desulfobacterales bacterium]|nr:PilN domain-containing protein [Desulfobacterales bacterium]MDJ0856398.1 PilN domain-containing protein [Desulfobacterales bacterium]MDJ0989563.1 PilN domain-containing protein [Desulfobacterales bacterium]